MQDNDILRWEDMSQADRIAVKIICEESLIGFVRIFFQLIQGQKFKRNWHHAYVCSKLESVHRGETKRLIINCSPGSTKTELFSIHWPVWCIIQAIKDKKPTRWLPLSYSDDLVTENTGRVKEILQSEEFQTLWPMVISKDTKGKSDWKFVDQNGKQHRMYGTSLMGQVTGRRAGFMIPGFTGALILDDPLPPRDESSGKKIGKFNIALNRIVRSRLAHDNIPIVMIQQRIAKNDSTHYLMSDKSPDKYELVKIPAVIDKEYVDSLPDYIKVSCIEDTGFKSEKISYWPDKEPTSTLKDIERADPYLYNSQYQQAPDDAFLEGVIYRKEVEALIADGRLTMIPIEKSLATFSYWDIGINDDMVLWLMQPFQQELRLIACYGNSNQGIEHYINWLHDFRDMHQVRFHSHYGPHDLEVRDVMTGNKRVDIAKQMGLEFNVVERTKLKGESIEALRRLFTRLIIDKNRCEKGFEGLKRYRREWDPDNEIFKDKPVHDWTSNYADALQQMSLYWDDALNVTRTKPKDGYKRNRNWRTI